MSEETRIVPLRFLQEMANFLQNELPMSKARQAVEVLEYMMRPQETKTLQEAEADG